MMDEIKYDYYSISLPHITEKSGSGLESKKNVISAVYQGRVNQPNISFIHPKTGSVNYQAVELFISKGQLMYPQETTHDAELIILHRPTTNSPKLYSCFLLKYNSQVTSTDIDAIIQTPSNMYNQELTLCMNDYITKKGSLDIYEKNSYIVVVFQDIIPIMGDGDKSGIYLPSLFSSPLHEGLTDTKDTIDNYFECEYLPGGINAGDVQVYEIPVGSQVYTDGTSSDWVSLVAKNVVVFMAASIAFFLFPQTYNFLKKKINDEPKFKYLTEPKWLEPPIFIMSNMGSWFNLILTLIFFIIAIILIIAGLSSLSNSLTLSGVVILFSYMFGYMGIMYLHKTPQTPLPTSTS
jgi:hypothetical protein